MAQQLREEGVEYETGEVRSDVGRWAIVPEWLLDSVVSAGAIKFFAVLAAKYADRQNGVAFPRRRTLAAACRVSDDTIDRYTDELEAIGALKTTRRKREDGSYGSSLYELLYSLPPRRTHTQTDPRTGAEGSPHPYGISYPESGIQNQFLSREEREEPLASERVLPAESIASPSPENLQDWKEVIRAAPHVGAQVTVLIDLVHHHTRDPVRKDDGGLAAALLKAAGDAEYAVALLWEAVNAGVEGSRFGYALGVARARRERTNGARPKTLPPRDVAKAWEDHMAGR